MNLTTVRMSPANVVLVGLLNFFVVWILVTVNTVLFFQFKLKMAVHVAWANKKIFEVSNFWYFFKKS